jgi:hypothetical protein
MYRLTRTIVAPAVTVAVAAVGIVRLVVAMVCGGKIGCVGFRGGYVKGFEGVDLLEEVEVALVAAFERLVGFFGVEYGGCALVEYVSAIHQGKP